MSRRVDNFSSRDGARRWSRRHCPRSRRLCRPHPGRIRAWPVCAEVDRPQHRPLPSRHVGRVDARRWNQLCPQGRHCQTLAQQARLRGPDLGIRPLRLRRHGSCHRWFRSLGRGCRPGRVRSLEPIERLIPYLRVCEAVLLVGSAPSNGRVRHPAVGLG